MIDYKLKSRDNEIVTLQMDLHDCENVALAHD